MEKIIVDQLEYDSYTRRRTVFASVELIRDRCRSALSSRGGAENEYRT